MKLDCGHEGDKYGTTPAGLKHCYACCGESDRVRMVQEGRITLYLTKIDDAEWRAMQVLKYQSAYKQYRITNWPGTLVFSPTYLRTSQGWGWGATYPIRTVQFCGPDGYIWNGRNAGRSNDLLHCKRTRFQYSKLQ